jgi:hypothetical protein
MGDPIETARRSTEMTTTLKRLLLIGLAGLVLGTGALGLGEVAVGDYKERDRSVALLIA